MTLDGAHGPCRPSAAIRSRPPSRSWQRARDGSTWWTWTSPSRAWRATSTSSRRSPALPVSVQASGGIVTRRQVEALLDAGATRVVLGLGARWRRATLPRRDLRRGERLVIGIEEDAGRIRSRGRAPVDLPLVETLGWVVAAGASAFLVTSVRRVGDLGGPDLELVRRVVRARAARCSRRAGSRPSTTSLALRAAGAVGAVVGTAALDGSLDLVGGARRARPDVRGDRGLDSPPHGVPHRPRRPVRRELNEHPLDDAALLARALRDASRAGLRGRPARGRAARADRRGEARVAVAPARSRTARTPIAQARAYEARGRRGGLGAHRAAPFPRLARRSRSGAASRVDLRCCARTSSCTRPR